MSYLNRDGLEALVLRECIKQLTAENARLRAALEKIVEYDIHNPMLPVTLAKEALKGQP